MHAKMCYVYGFSSLVATLVQYCTNMTFIENISKAKLIFIMKHFQCLAILLNTDLTSETFAFKTHKYRNIFVTLEILALKCQIFQKYWLYIGNEMMKYFLPIFLLLKNVFTSVLKEFFMPILPNIYIVNTNKYWFSIVLILGLYSNNNTLWIYKNPFYLQWLFKALSFLPESNSHRVKSWYLLFYFTKSSEQQFKTQRISNLILT